MNYRVVDAIQKRKNPEAWERARKRLQGSWPKFDAEQVESYWRERWREHLASFDPGMIEAAGLTVDDLVKRREHRLRRKTDCRETAQASDELVNTFADSIIRSEAGGLSFSEAVSRALIDIMEEHGHDMKPETARAWLKDAIKFKVCDIEPPKRGRPSKKTP